MTDITDELQAFARLRPSDVTLTDDERAAMAATLFGGDGETRSANLQLLVDDDGQRGSEPFDNKAGSTISVLGEARISNRPRHLVLAAAAVVLLAVAGLALTRVATDLTADQVETTAGSGSYEAPLVIVDHPEWMTADVRPLTRGFSIDLLLVDALESTLEDTLDGSLEDTADRAIGVYRLPPGLTAEFESGAETIDINGRPGALERLDSGVLVLEYTAAFGDVVLFAIGVNEDELVDVASKLTIGDDGSLKVETLAGGPDGLVEAGVPVTEAFNQSSTSTFFPRSPDSANTTRSPIASATVQGGGRLIQGVLSGTLPASQEISFGDETATLHTEGDLFRLIIQRGFWVWTITGEGFEDEAAFLDVAANITETDRTTWEASFGPETYDRATAKPIVAELVGDIPLPDGVSRDSLIEPTIPATRYSLAADIEAAVACAWLAWASSGEVDNSQARAEAVSALETWDQWAVQSELGRVLASAERGPTRMEMLANGLRYADLRAGGPVDAAARFFNCDRRQLDQTFTGEAPIPEGIEPDGTEPDGTESASETFEESQITEPPLIAVDLPGFDMTYVGASEVDMAQRRLLVDPQLGLDGPVIDVAVWPEGTQLGFVGAEPVDIGGTLASYATTGDLQWLDFNDSNENHVSMTGWQVSKDDLFQAADIVANSGRSIEALTDAVGRLTPTDDGLAAQLNRIVTYSFYNGVDRGAEVNLYPGAEYMLQARRLTDEHEKIMVNGETAYLVEYGGTEGRFRLNVVRDSWVWEVDAASFNSRQEFLDFAASIVTVNADEWYEALPEDMYGPDDLDVAVAQAVAETPLPNDLNSSLLAQMIDDGSPAQTRTDMLSEVTRNVFCAWFAELVRADREGDEPARQKAVDALGSTRQWESLEELAEWGVWSESMWEMSDDILRMADDGELPPSTSGSFGCI